MTTGRLCHEQNISIHAVLQRPIRNPRALTFVLTTETCRKSQIDALCTSIHTQEWCTQPPLALPML